MNSTYTVTEQQKIECKFKMWIKKNEEKQTSRGNSPKAADTTTS